MITEELKKNIVERISHAVDVQSIILFGSHAYGTPSEDSDIDLLVVVNKDEIPKNYDEKSEIYLSVSRSIRPIRTEIPIDLIVYTRPEFNRFKEIGSLFSQKILSEGVSLL